MEFRLTKKQSEANAMLAGSETHCCLEGGSRSGKTFLIVRAMVIRALKAPGSRHAIFRFRFNHVVSSVFYDTLPKVMELCFPGRTYKSNKQDWFVTFENGSQIWFGGLDDKERTEKVLGQEYSTIFFNECSQIPWSSRGIALTRLAQKVDYIDAAGTETALKPRAYYDYNPPSTAHWTYVLFESHRDPESKQPVENSGDICRLEMNPVDNSDNLPAGYMSMLEALPSRLRKRFLYGEYSDASNNALFQSEMIDRWRHRDGELPDFQRVIIAVDPSGADDTDNADNDEIGIVVAALGTDGIAYIVEDLTLKAGPAKWGQVIGTAFDRHAADRVVGEANYGGAMVKHVVQTARPGTPYIPVTATRGKVVRAEPISSLAEQGKVRMVGFHPRLEDELCGMTSSGYVGDKSPNRADAYVWAVTELFPALTRKKKEVKKGRQFSANRAGRDGWMAA